MENLFIKKTKLPTLHPFDVPHPFSSHEHIFELYHEFLILNSNELFLVDKKTLVRTEVAKIDSPIIHFSPSPCNKHYILVTGEETILLNDKFDVIKSEGVTTTKCHVCWGDDQILISRESISIYDFELKLLYNGYGHSPMAFRQDYFVYCIHDDGKFKFIEQNGLVLEILENIKIEGAVKEIHFLNKNMMVGIVDNEQSLFVMYCHSNYWYLKKMIKIGFCKIHSTKGNCVYIKYNNVLWEYAIEEYLVDFNGVFAVNDGLNVKITNFNEGFVPPPLDHYKIQYKDCINSVSVWEDYVCLMSFTEILVFKNKEIYKILHLKEILDSSKIIKNVVNGESTPTHDDLMQRIENIGINEYFNYVEIFKHKIYLIYGSNIFVYSLLENKIIDVSFLENINRIYIWDEEICYRDNKYLYCQKMNIPVMNNQTLVLSSHDGIYLYLIDNTLNIIKGTKTIIIDQVSSFKIHKDYLLFIKNEKLVTLNLKSNLYQVCSLHENHTKILHVLDTKIILQAKWGNFEIFESRFFIHQKINNLIEHGKFQEAIQLAKENCILYTIFTNKCFSVKEFINSLCDISCIVSFAFQIYEEFGNLKCISKIPLEGTIDLNNQTFSLYENIDFVFDPKVNTKNIFIKHLMNGLGEENDEIKVKIYTKLSLLDEAMFIIMKNLDLLSSAFHIQQDEKLIQAALGTYNLEFAELVIKKSSKEIYLDFITEIKGFKEIDKRIAINKTLNRKNKVLFYLSQKSTEEERKFIIENKLFEILPLFRDYYGSKCHDELSFLSIYDKRFNEELRETEFYDVLQAEYYYNVDKGKSINFFLSANLNQQAFDVALEMKDWKWACEINENLNVIENYLLIIQSLIKVPDYRNVALIYKKYLNDNTNAYLYFVKSYQYKEAQDLDHTKFTLDLPNLIKENNTEIKSNLEYIKVLIIRFDGIIARKSTDNDMLTSSTMTTSSKKNVLRNKVGSRFEKEYVLDQIRKTIENINMIKESLNEVDYNIEIEFQDIKESVLRVFKYAHDNYDGNGPLIELPRLCLNEWDEIQF